MKTLLALLLLGLGLSACESDHELASCTGPYLALGPAPATTVAARPAKQPTPVKTGTE